MDLRKYGINESQQQRAIGCLNYQPFIISDDVQTGVAYSWLHSEEGGRLSNASDFVLDRRDVAEDRWQKFADANSRLRCMYDDWVDEIAKTYPGGTLVDPACNNGYFPVGALIRGMSAATGYDRDNHSVSVALLNEILGTNAVFHHQAYSSWTHCIDECQPHDVAVTSLIMCHISDPTYFLAFLGKIAREAIFLFTGMGIEPGYRVYYSKPNKFYRTDEFPVCFDNDVALSKDLLFDSLCMMGFKNIKVLEHRQTWLPQRWYNTGNQKAILAMR
jgi:hypothetical protein